MVRGTQRAAAERARLRLGAGDRRALGAATAASATPAAERRNPFAVLGTMVVVGGMFAVAGLPAYAQTVDEAGAAQPLSLAAAQSLEVSAETQTAEALRDGYRATTPEQLAQMTLGSVRAGNREEYLASGAMALGDDYPWAYELSVDQGGGLSPLNYYYRQCTDFVAWRINRDAGSVEAPYKYVWSNLTPTGGDARQWRYAWQQHGWTVSSTPIVGSVAWFASNHVAYVKQVLDDGAVLIEEYNYIPNVYSQRTLQPSEVDAFLYPPAS
ncbi:MAG TPA: CHAP domain-containing protein [Rhodoglobus sp.]|nr:CHAP domain-containing protein [Rhodoglobus sp.]